MQKIGNRLVFLIIGLILISCTGSQFIVNPEQTETNQIAKPILQIDTGGHKAIINDIFFTKHGKYLVSASDDKTVRVWDVKTGKIHRIFRGQIGKGSEGKIYAAALSPDNRLLAVGGFMAKGHGIDDDKVGNIRIIDFQTGKVLHLLEGHYSVIHSLNFSKNNRLLISGSGLEDITAKIWNINTGKTLHTLQGHTEPIYAVAFSPNNKLAVTGSLDHTLKLWKVSNGSLITTLKGHKDDVVSAAFTPDGKYILSGSDDKTISLWNGKTGQFIKVLATQATTVDSLTISRDGKFVLTGSGDGSGQTCNVFSIPSGKKISYFDKHENIVLATAISPDGTIAATGGGDDQEIYLWDLKTGKEKIKITGNGKVVWSVGFSKNQDSIAWGNTWERANLFGHRSPFEHSFIINSKTGEFGPGHKIPEDDEYIRAIEKAQDISIQTQNGQIHPTLEILKKGKIIHTITRGSTDGYAHESMTLTPDGKTVISGGGNGVLASYNTETGREIHKFIGHTGDVWGLVVSPDARLLVSGSTDQTVKLWEIKTGKLLATLFYGTDSEWVFWTPEGFYAASPNGEKYVGYHINRGQDKAADYVRVDQIGRLFYRPDLVAKKIQGGFEHEIQSQIAKIGNIDQIIKSGLPPEIRIISKPVNKINTRNFTLKFSLKDIGGGIGNIEYRVNGAVIGSDSRFSVPVSYTPSDIISEYFTLQDGDNIIEVIGSNNKRTIESRPVKVQVQVHDPLKHAPLIYVLAVGISDYQDSTMNLKFAHNDALAIANRLEKQGKGLFKEIYVKTLINKQATAKAIEREFIKLSKKVKTNDVFVLYLAGHGKAINGDYYFIPYEAIYESSKALQEKSISHDKFSSLITKIPALKSLLIIDTCYSGILAQINEKNMLTSLSRGDIGEKTAIERLMRSTGRTILAATSSARSMEGYNNHGFFTWTLLQGLSGKADRKGDGYGVITVDELAGFARERLPEITKQKIGYEQFPMRLIQGDPFAIACSQGFEGTDCKQ